MNVGIDIGSLVYQRGVSRYTSNVIQALLEHTKSDVFLFGSSFRQRTFLKSYAQRMQKAWGDRVDSQILSLPPSVLEKIWRFVRRPQFASSAPLDVFHSWDWLQPPDFGVPIVSTIHDVAMLRFPESAHPGILAAHQKSWDILKERRAQIIAVSYTTKKDLVELLDWDPSDITVIYEALPQEVFHVSDELTDELTQKYLQHFKLDKPFMLCVGTREPRKNLTKTIQAWQQFSHDFDLVVVGETGWDDSQQAAGEGVKFLGRVSDRALAALYSEAELFLYPSLYEGFGLPILEAFHYAVPVVTSDNSGMKEVAGNAAVLVQPEDVDSIATGIKTVLNEHESQRQLRIQKMIIRQQHFTWRRTAQETLQVYTKAHDMQTAV